MKVSPAKNEPRTNCTWRSTRGLSCGDRTRAGSILNPRACAYSTNAWLNRGSSGSAPSTTADRLSGINVANTPPKNTHAASHPAITDSVVWRWVNQTKQCRLTHAVKINACTTRSRPAAGSKIRPMRPKSICNSSPGSPSLTRTVDPRPRVRPRTSVM